MASTSFALPALRSASRILARPLRQAKSVHLRVGASRVAELGTQATMASSKEQIKDRARAAILGGLVADAATMPLHWLYDIEKLQGLLASADKTASPEFFAPPSCPFYQAPLGDTSPYGQEFYALLKSVAEEGALDADAYSKELVAHFNSGEYYRNHCVKSAIANVEAGKLGTAAGDDKDFMSNCFSRVAVVVVRYLGHDDMLDRVEAAVRVQQNNDDAVRYGRAAAAILQKVIQGGDVKSTLEWVAEGHADPTVVEVVKRTLAALDTPPTDVSFTPHPMMLENLERVKSNAATLPAFTVACWFNNPSCLNPGAFFSSLLASVSADDYATGVRLNMAAGGDNCARASYIGSLLAAQGGMSAIPAEWWSKTTRFPEYEKLADKILADAGY